MAYQAERTVLAYGRTLLVTPLAIAILGREAEPGAERVGAVVVGVVALVGMTLAMALRRHQLHLAPTDPGEPRVTVAVVLGGMTVLQAAALALILI